MTTIAYKNGILASDGRMTMGTRLLSDRYRKIFDVESKDFSVQDQKVLAYALAGSVKSRLVFERAMAEGLDVLSGLDSDDDFAAIAVTQETAFLVTKDEEKSSFGIIELFEDTPYAIGSGSAVANYILQQGKDPLDAVSIAIKTDIGSGGELFRWERNGKEKCA